MRIYGTLSENLSPAHRLSPDLSSSCGQNNHDPGVVTAIAGRIDGAAHTNVSMVSKPCAPLRSRKARECRSLQCLLKMAREGAQMTSRNRAAFGPDSFPSIAVAIAYTSTRSGVR